MRSKFRNVRFGDAEEYYVTKIADMMRLSLDKRGVYSEVVRFALRVVALGYIPIGDEDLPPVEVTQ